MKKFVAATLTAALLALGLVGLTAGTASAECSNPAYPNCTNPSPKPKVPDTANVGSKAKLKFKPSVAGNVEPTGRVKFTVKAKNGYKFTTTKTYKGGFVKAKTGKFPRRGLYVVTIKFFPTPGTIFGSAKSKDTIKVG